MSYNFKASLYITILEYKYKELYLYKIEIFDTIKLYYSLFVQKMSVF